MLERELFALLERTADAAYTVTATGAICSWNNAAMRLFGFTPGEALHRNIEELLDARDSLGTHALAGGTAAATRRTDSSLEIPHFDLEVRKRDGARIWINVSTIIHDDERTRRRLYVRLARDITTARQRSELVERFVALAREVTLAADGDDAPAPVVALTDQERRILTLFAEGRTPGAVMRELGISSQTLRNHLHHVNRKLRTHTRLEAVMHAQHRGLIGS